MAVISVGDGRLIEFDEGALNVPPPEPPKPKVIRGPYIKKRKVVRSKAVVLGGHKFKCMPPGRVKREGPTDEARAVMASIPGFQEWRGRRAAEVRICGPTQGKPVGRANGMTADQSDRMWMLARRQARKDMKAIKERIDLTDAAEEALLSTLEVMRSPMNQASKLAAAKLVLDFTMAKPVAKSEVTLNAAEQWLAEIGKTGDAS